MVHVQVNHEHSAHGPLALQHARGDGLRRGPHAIVFSIAHARSRVCTLHLSPPHARKRATVARTRRVGRWTGGRAGGKATPVSREKKKLAGGSTGQVIKYGEARTERRVRVVCATAKVARDRRHEVALAHPPGPKHKPPDKDRRRTQNVKRAATTTPRPAIVIRTGVPRSEEACSLGGGGRGDDDEHVLFC